MSIPNRSTDPKTRRRTEDTLRRIWKAKEGSRSSVPVCRNDREYKFADHKALGNSAVTALKPNKKTSTQTMSPGVLTSLNRLAKIEMIAKTTDEIPIILSERVRLR